MNYDKTTGTYSGKEVFAVEVKDNHGGVDTKYITMDVTATVGAGNPPVITTQVTTPPTVGTTQPPATTTNTTPPSNAVTIDLAAGSDSGSSHTDNLTSDKTPSITGTTDIPFSKVEILEGGKVIATTTSNASGAYSVDTSALTDAAHSLSAQATAPSSTTAVSSPNLDVTVDTTIHATDDTATTDEDHSAAITGSVLTNDDHANGEVVTPQTLATAHGQYNIDAKGDYSFVLDTSKTQSLVAGQSETDSITYTVTDKAGNVTTAILTTTITGTNDAPTVATALTAQTAETGNDISYTVPAGTFTDVDTGDTLTYSATLKDGSALPSWLHFDANAQTFTGTPPSGSAGTVETRVIATDSQGATVHSDFDINVTAFSGNTGNISEDGLTTTLSGLVHSAVDTFSDATTKGTYGELEMRSNGQWIYKLDNSATNVQGLKGGEVVHDVIAITAKDGTVQHIDVAITGTHDLPTLTLPNAGTDVISAVEQHNVDASMDMSLFTPQNNGVAVGHRIMHMYAPGSSVDLLANIPVSERPTTSQAYTHGGSTGYSYLQNMWFSNHLASTGMDFSAQAPSMRNAMDGGVYVFDDGSVGLAQKACDGVGNNLTSYIYYQIIDHVNANDGFSLIRGQAAAGSSVEIFDGTTSLGTATANAQGEFTLPIFSKQSDGTHAYHTVINGVSSSAQEFAVSGDQVDSVAGGVDAGSITEDATIDHISGNLHIHDVDINDHPVIAAQTDTAGAYGKFSIDAQGNWHYELDNSKVATNNLHSGQSVTESFHIITTTDSGERVDTVFSIDVHGHDDAPTVGATAQKTLAEGDPAFSSFIAGHDNSGNADSTLVYTTHTTAAGFTFNADGTYSIDPKNPAYDHLAVGEHASIDVPVTVTDKTGASVVSHIHITITGTNDVPVVSSTTANLGAILEDTDHTYTQAELLHLVGASDVDGDNLSVSGIHIDAKYGTFTHSGTSWVFHPATNVGANNIAITMDISDGHSSVTSQGVIGITAVADGVTPVISMAAVPVTTHVAAVVGHIEDHFTSALGVNAVGSQNGAWFENHAPDANPNDGAWVTLTKGDQNFDWSNLLSITVNGTKIEIGSDPLFGLLNNPTDTSSVFGQVIDLDYIGVDRATMEKIIIGITHKGSSIEFEYAPGVAIQDPHLGFRLTSVPFSYDKDLYEGALDSDSSGGVIGYSIPLDSDRMRGAVAAHDTTTQAAAPQPVEEGEIPLHVTLTHLDTDGSEQISKIIMSGLPAGATLSAGTKNADGSFTLSEADLASLKMTPPKDFSGSVVVHLEVTTTDSTDGHVVDTKVDSTDFHLTVMGVAEIPTLATTDVTVNEDSGPIALGVQLTLHIDPSEVQEVKITGIPNGVTLSAGHKQSDGSWLLSPADTHNLRMITPANYINDTHLQITATSTDGADVASASKSLVVHINPVLDMTVSAPTDVSGQATQPIDLHVLVGNMVDAGEKMEHIRVHLPDGWEIEGITGFAGANATAGSGKLFEMTQDQLIHAKIIPPAGFTGTQDISIIEEVREKGVTFSIDTPLTIHVANTAPVVASPVTDTVDEDADAHHTLDLLSGASDVDGDTLSVTGVTNLPAGVTLAADGHTLVVDSTNAAFQHLAAGVTNDIVVNYQITDGHGGSVAQSATVTVTGTNDTPTVTAVTDTVDEDTSHTFSAGEFGFNDIDTGATLDHITIKDLPAHGTLTFNGNAIAAGQDIAVADIGKLVFAPAKDENGTGYAQFHVTGSDGHEDSAPVQVLFNVNAINDKPIIVNTIADTHLDTTQHSSSSSMFGFFGSSSSTTHLSTGTLQATDPDAGDTHTWSISGGHNVTQGGHTFVEVDVPQGKLIVDPGNGHYVFEATSTQASGMFFGMFGGSSHSTQTGTAEFQITATDKAGAASTPEFLTLQVGANGVSSATVSQIAPAIAPAHTDAALTVNLADISDTGTSHTDNLTKDTTPTLTGTGEPNSQVVIVDAAGHVVGHGLIDASGSYSIDVTTALADGQQGLTVKAMSPQGVVQSAVQSLSVDTQMSTPTSDLTDATDTGFSQADNITKTHNPVIIGHADAGSTVVITDASGAQVGTARANSQGQYSVATSSLSEGDHTLTITSTDTSGNSATINQAVHVDTTAPTFTMVQVDYINTPVHHITGTVDSDAHSVDVVITDIGTRAVLETLHAVLDGNGGWSVDTSNLPDGGYNATPKVVDAAGNVSTHGMHDFFKVDTQVQALTLSLTNDTGTSTSDNITTDGQLSIGNKESTTAVIEYSTDGTTWISSFTPVDGSNTVYVRQTDLAGNVSTPTSLTFTLDNSAPAPTVELLHDTGPYHTADQQLLTDKITSNAQLHVTHEAGANVEYSVDGGHTWSASFNPTHDGQFGVEVRQTDPAGNVSPVTHFDFTYDTTKPVFTVQNTPDSNNPVYTLSGSADSKMTEMSVHITKIGEHNAEQVLHPTVDANGNWHITTTSLPDADYKVEVSGTDAAGNSLHMGHGTSILASFTIDTTVTAADDTATATEDQTAQVSGNVLTNDDHGTTVTTTGDIAGKYGMYHLSADGSYTYTLDNSKPEVQAFSDGSHHDDPISYTITDAAGNTTTATLTTTITGKDDAAVISGTDSATVQEDVNVDAAGHIEVGGTLVVTDPDSGQNQFTAFTKPGRLGNFEMHTDGSWSFVSDNSNLQRMPEGQSIPMHFEVQSADGTKHTVTVNLVGTNDAPILTAETLSVNEDGSALNGKMIAIDVDNGSSNIERYSVSNPPSGFSITPDGTYSFNPSHADYQHLAQGQQEIITIPVTVTDAFGASDTKDITITVTGTDDAPTVTQKYSNIYSVDEDSSDEYAHTGGTHGIEFIVKDPDAGDTHTVVLDPAHPLKWGTVTFQGDTIIYRLDNSNPATNAFRTGQTAREDIWIIVGDGHGGTVSKPFYVQIHGHSDVVHDEVTTTEESSVTLQLMDPNISATQHYVDQTIHGKYGALHLQTDGTWTYTPDARAQHLAQGQDSYDKFAITSPDGNNHAIKVTVQGLNDAPTVGQALSAQSIDEGNGLHFTIPSDTFHDVDTSDTLTYKATKADGSALPSWLHFNPATQTFSGTAGHGDDGIVGVKVTATDGSNAQVSSNFNLSVIDNNQAPVITTVTHNHDHSSGQIHATDTDTLQYTVKHQGAHQYGTLNVQPDGSFQYAPDSHINTAGMQLYGGKGGWHHKGGSRTGQDLFEVQISDGKGGTVTKFLSFAVHTDFNGHHPQVTGASDSDSMFQTRIANVDPQSATIKEDVVIDSLRISSGGMISVAEAATALAVTGSVRGVYKDGDLVTLHVNGKEFTGEVHNGDFSVDIPATDLAADTNLQATISTTSSAGEPLTALQGMEYHVDADGLVVLADVADTPNQIDELPDVGKADAHVMDGTEQVHHTSAAETAQPVLQVAEVEASEEQKHAAVKHEVEQQPADDHDLSGLIAPEEDPLNLDAATDSGGMAKAESGDTADTDPTDHKADETVDAGSVATAHDTDAQLSDHDKDIKKPEHGNLQTDVHKDDGGTVDTHDVLDSHEDHKVDDLLAAQPEKAPVAAPVTEHVPSDAGSHHDSDPAPVADTATLDSNLVDTPEDQ